MTVLDLANERRRRRSNDTHTALRYQLEHIHDKLGLDNFVLADSRGLAWAHAGDGEASEVLAAYAPVLATHPDHTERRKVLDKVERFVPDAADDNLTIRSFEIDGETLFLCVMGRDKVAQQAGLYRAVTGIRRIMRQTPKAA